MHLVNVTTACMFVYTISICAYTSELCNKEDFHCAFYFSLSLFMGMHYSFRLINPFLTQLIAASQEPPVEKFLHCTIEELGMVRSSGWRGQVGGGLFAFSDLPFSHLNTSSSSSSSSPPLLSLYMHWTNFRRIFLSSYRTISASLCWTTILYARYVLTYLYNTKVDLIFVTSL